MYAVYQLKDPRETDHSGNRNYATGFTENLQEATARANQLNEEDVDLE